MAGKEEQDPTGKLHCWDVRKGKRCDNLTKTLKQGKAVKGKCTEYVKTLCNLIKHRMGWEHFKCSVCFAYVWCQACFKVQLTKNLSTGKAMCWQYREQSEKTKHQVTKCADKFLNAPGHFYRKNKFSGWNRNTTLSSNAWMEDNDVFQDHSEHGV